LGRLTTVVQSGQTGGAAVSAKRADIARNALGQMTALTRYASVSQSTPVAGSEYYYDQDNRLSGISHYGLAATTNFSAEYYYTYDAASRITSYATTDPNESTAYAYDALDQLTDADLSGTSNDRAYDYDDNGNRTSDSSAAYLVGPFNRIQSDNLYAYQYDDEGNLTRKTRLDDNSYVAYAWDHRNRLTEAAWYTEEDTLISGATFTYDAFNQLIGRGSEALLYDGGQAVLRFEGGDLLDRYLWAYAVDQLLADEQLDNVNGTVNDETFWAMTDAQGSVRNLIDDNAIVRKHVAYDAFGKIRFESWYDATGGQLVGTQPWSQAGAVDQVFYYTGRLFDKATGLQNNLNRWYDPAIGRWLSEDPIGFEAGDANLYRYVGNGPTNGADPAGLWFDWIVSPIRSWREWRRGVELDRQHDKLRQKQIDRDLATDPERGLHGLQDLQRDQRRRAAEDAKCLANTAVQFDAMALGGGFVGGGSAREVGIIRNRTIRPGVRVNIDDAVNVVREGGDIMADCRDTARSIAHRAGNGPPIWDPPHLPRQKPHFHPSVGGERGPGHVMY
jgi:RHS repeat-associated protein